MNYTKMSTADLEKELAALRAKYDAYCAKRLSLDLSRGKPGSEQIDLVTDRIDDIGADALKCKKLALPSTGAPLGQLTFNF